MTVLVVKVVALLLFVGGVASVVWGWRGVEPREALVAGVGAAALVAGAAGIWAVATA